ncbi:MAG TPA: nucleotide sugar dehydrogenase [Candidatus Krumholzibacteria bacterium]|nr:nucleotide sugar dehydrogenase [Candidatus Krumholzibacteria bacterium]
MSLVDKLRDRSATCGVIGLGYVGLPLVMEFVRAGYRVIGYDVDAAKVARLREGDSYVGDVPSSSLKEAVESGAFQVTTDPARLAEVDTIDICVPTPLSKTRDPDMSYIDTAVEAIARVLRAGQLVVLESTTYPGTTEEVILPRLRETGLEVGKDFFLAFSPERVDPGNPKFQTGNIPKVVGGITPACGDVAAELFSHCISEVVKVSNARVAETVKLLENTFRSVNIGLVNEIAQMCHKMDIDVWEVIDAAATKPFGFMPFYPGPGLGGHCIPIDPFYLSWKARASGFEARFIELAGFVNRSMPEFVTDLVGQALNEVGRAVRGSRVVVVGVAYKSDIDDVRESPALDVLQLLHERGADLSWIDAHVPALRDFDFARKIDTLDDDFDAAVITAVHRDFDHTALLERCARVVDTRNALRGVDSEKIVRL